YAFCRQADDSVDAPGSGEAAQPAALLARVAALRRRLARVYAGRIGDGDDPGHAIDRAFRAVLQRTGLPQAVPERLLTGMEMDAAGARYRTWEELLGYCFNVAGTVGLMMTYSMGHRMPAPRR